MIEGQIFTHEYHQISVNSVSRFSLKKKKIVETSDGFKKTVQNQKHPSTVIKKTVQVAQFFHQRSFVFLILNSFFETSDGFNNFLFFWEITKDQQIFNEVRTQSTLIQRKTLYTKVILKCTLV